MLRYAARDPTDIMPQASKLERWPSAMCQSALTTVDILTQGGLGGLDSHIAIPMCTPRHATPRHATPHHTTPHHTTPHHTIAQRSSYQSGVPWYGVLPSSFPALSLRVLTSPRPYACAFACASLDTPSRTTTLPWAPKNSRSLGPGKSRPVAVSLRPTGCTLGPTLRCHCLGPKTGTYEQEVR